MSSIVVARRGLDTGMDSLVGFDRLTGIRKCARSSARQCGKVAFERGCDRRMRSYIPALQDPFQCRGMLRVPVGLNTVGSIRLIDRYVPVIR